MKNLFLASFLWCMFSVSVWAQTCQDYNKTIISPSGSGSATISGQICFTATDLTQPLTGAASITFNDFNNSGQYNIDFSASGTFDFEYYANSVQPGATKVSVKYMGGPVNYTINNQNFEVYFNDLQYSFDAQGSQLTESGSVTVNGNTFEAGSINYGYVRIF